MTETTRTERQAKVEGHGGALAVAVARRRGVSAMFTLSGAHVFPLYDGAVKADPPLPLIDVRHEQTAVFAAEGLAKLTRVPGLAVVTAGPGVTNSVSAVTTAWVNGSPLLALGLPVIANGLGRGVLPAGHELLVTRARSLAFGAADLVIVAGAPLDFRLGYGAFGGSSGQPARVVQLADSPG